MHDRGKRERRARERMKERGRESEGERQDIDKCIVYRKKTSRWKKENEREGKRMREGRTRKIVCNERVRKRDKRKMYYMREKKRQRN